MADSAQPSITVRGQPCREACTYTSTGQRQNGPWLLCRYTVLPKEGAGPRVGSQLRQRVLPWASPAGRAGEHGALGAPPTGTRAQEVAPIRGPASLRRPLLSNRRDVQRRGRGAALLPPAALPAQAGGALPSALEAPSLTGPGGVRPPSGTEPRLTQRMDEPLPATPH